MLKLSWLILAMLLQQQQFSEGNNNNNEIMFQFLNEYLEESLDIEIFKVQFISNRLAASDDLGVRFEKHFQNTFSVLSCFVRPSDWNQISGGIEEERIQQELTNQSCENDFIIFQCLGSYLVFMQKIFTETFRKVQTWV